VHHGNDGSSTYPSYELVPLPNSSRMTNDLGVASDNIFFVSESSTKNVL
jgi:hypothetical protein